MNDDLSPLMMRVPDPAPPPTLSATVMARIARADEARPMATAPPVPARREWTAWAWSVAGLAMVIGASVWGWMTVSTLPDVFAPRIGPGGQSLLPGGVATLAITAGVFLYLAGLFAPLRRRRH